MATPTSETTSSHLSLGHSVTQSQRSGDRVLKRYRIAQKVVGIAIVILFALTAVFVSLSLFDKIHPLVSVGTLVGSLVLLFVMRAVDACRQKSATSHGIDLKKWDAAYLPNDPSTSDSDSDDEED